MADIAAIRAGIAANISLALGESMQVSPYMISVPSPPCVYVIPDGITFDKAFVRGTDELRFVVRVLMPSTSDIGSQQALDLMCTTTDVTSIKNAVESDMTLGATVSWARVTDASAPKLVQHDGAPPYLSVDFAVQVMS